jgi:hypothetical protein
VIWVIERIGWPEQEMEADHITVALPHIQGIALSIAGNRRSTPKWRKTTRTGGFLLPAPRLFSGALGIV